MKFATALLLTVSAFGQEAPEIRGTVIEFGPNTGIAGVTVTLSESVAKESDNPYHTIATIVTDTLGRFSFRPGHYGDYYVNANLPGYSDPPIGVAASFANTRVDDDTPRVVALTLLRPASLTGRFVDGDGKPIGELPVSAVEMRRPPIDGVVTNQDGVFVFRDLLPGSYVVRPLPPARSVAVMGSFTPADAEAVDEDYESSYWPGGAPTQQSALPITVPPGRAADLGTIILRRVAYHRVRVPVRSECAAGEKWNLAFLEVPTTRIGPPLSVACTIEFLLRNVRPGSYTLGLSSPTRDIKSWALARVFVANRNTTVPLAMAPPIDIAGRFTGSAKPTEFTVFMGAIDLRGSQPMPATPDAEGRFIMSSVVWPRHRIAIETQNPGSFVKEIRYNNQTVTDSIFDLVPGATFAVTVDNGAATVTGKVAGAKTRREAAVFLTRWPRGEHPTTIEPAPPFQNLAMLDANGAFRFSSLAPGMYRIVAIPFGPAMNLPDPLLFSRLILQAETITVEQGATKTMELKLVDLTK